MINNEINVSNNYLSYLFGRERITIGCLVSLANDIMNMIISNNGNILKTDFDGFILHNGSFNVLKNTLFANELKIYYSRYDYKSLKESEEKKQKEVVVCDVDNMKFNITHVTICDLPKNNEIKIKLIQKLCELYTLKQFKIDGCLSKKSDELCDEVIQDEKLSDVFRDVIILTTEKTINNAIADFNKKLEMCKNEIVLEQHVFRKTEMFNVLKQLITTKIKLMVMDFDVSFKSDIVRYNVNYEWLLKNIENTIYILRLNILKGIINARIKNNTLIYKN